MPSQEKPQSHWLRNSLLGAGALGAGYLGDKYFNGGQAVSSLSKGLFNATGLDMRSGADVAKSVDGLLYNAPRSVNDTVDAGKEAVGTGTAGLLEGSPWLKGLAGKLPTGIKDLVNPITGAASGAVPTTFGGKLLSSLGTGLNGLGAAAGAQQAYEGAGNVLKGNGAFAKYMGSSPTAQHLFKGAYGLVGAAANSNPITRAAMLPVMASNAYNNVVDSTAEGVQHPVETGRLATSYNALMNLARNHANRGVGEWHKQMSAIHGINPSIVQNVVSPITPYQNREMEMLQYLKTNNPDAYNTAKQVLVNR